MAVLYNNISGGSFKIFFTEPKMFFIMLLPFLPACVAGIVAGGLNKKYNALAEKHKT